ncbi:MAG: hypothetical protein IRY91_12820, partial [Gemmatimonadaceae bacterium]|nr:hypothetical protein [Gemmatimonadaceae bacterium]
MRTLRLVPALACLAGLVAPTARAQTARQLDSATLAGFRWRSIGPANMGGRIADIVGIPSPSKTFYVATAAGGIWKTTNAGTTFRPIFEHERVVSMGALAIAPSDTNIIWAGTGEQNTRNSISPGGGIYKSTDGGAHWKLMGLEATQQIARIVVHPTNPNIVYVAALGHAWGPNKERGLYKTTDGGNTWQLIKFVSDKAGFVDVVMDPSDPNTLYAASYERVRGPYFLQSGGPGSALWKTTDGGATWKEIRGNGFPTTMLGRIGLAIARSNPKVVYALVEADTAPNPKGRKGVGKPQKSQSGLYRSTDGGVTWTHMNDKDVRPFYYSQVRVDPKDPDRVYWSSTPVNFSDDGGKTVRQATLGIHVDHHAMWIDPNDPEHFVVGDDGGVSQTWDRGGNYQFLNIMAIGQFYEVSYDMAVPYRVCGGLQDNGSWCGPSRTKSGAITNSDWFTVGGGDGFYTAQDPTNPNIIYAESQGGNIGRLDYATGERTPLIKPSWRPRYQQYEDSIIIARGDTTKPASKEVTRHIAELRAKQKADSADLDLRFNWNTPYFISAHSAATLYIGGNRVLKSTDRGNHIFPISPDLSTKDTMKIRISMKTTGGITTDATGAETYGTITALAESPIRPGLLFAGTDDGNVWLTRNDGATWENLTGRFPGVPRGTYVARIEPSHFDTATVYIAFDNHRVNDFTPYLYVSTDYGKTFRSIVHDLPTGGPDFLHVIREDPVNRDLLFVGTDVGAYVSLDRGEHWQRFMTGLPTVPVHDLKIHPRDHELIAATHGRSIWIVDIAPLEQMRDSVLAASEYLFEPKTAFEFGEPPRADIEPGHQVFQVASAPYGADIAYRLTSGTRRDTAKIVIMGVKGDTVRTLTGPGGPGLHHVTWDFRMRAPRAKPLSPAARRDSIVTARKMDQVFDSLAAAHVAPKPALDRIHTMLASGGDLGELFRRGRGVPGVFRERPGESPLPRAGRQRGGAAEGDSAAPPAPRPPRPAPGAGAGGGGGV